MIFPYRLLATLFGWASVLSYKAYSSYCCCVSPSALRLEQPHSPIVFPRSSVQPILRILVYGFERLVYYYFSSFIHLDVDIPKQILSISVRFSKYLSFLQKILQIPAQKIEYQIPSIERMVLSHN